MDNPKNEKTEIATLAGGCFWCTEAIFQRLLGVLKVEPGYSGGEKANPTYEEVCSGETGHAEAIQITFDPKIITYEALLEIFFKLHDPTTPNRQGNDVGTQYRSVIFYNEQKQKDTAEKVREKKEKERMYQNRIVTEITAYKNFYKAENYHQNYYQKNSYQPYCQVVIDPKIHKLFKEFNSNIKPEYK